MVAEIHALPDDNTPVTRGAPVIRLKRKTENGGREKRLIVFYIDDEAYTIPAEPGAELALQVMDVIAESGQEVGIVYMLKSLLGEAGYQALKNYKGLDRKDLEAIVAKAMEVLNGTFDGPKAN